MPPTPKSRSRFTCFHTHVRTCTRDNLDQINLGQDLEQNNVFPHNIGVNAHVMMWLSTTRVPYRTWA